MEMTKSAGGGGHGGGRVEDGGGAADLRVAPPPQPHSPPTSPSSATAAAATTTTTSQLPSTSSRGRGGSRRRRATSPLQGGTAATTITLTPLLGKGGDVVPCVNNKMSSPPCPSEISAGGATTHTQKFVSILRFLLIAFLFLQHFRTNNAIFLLSHLSITTSGCLSFASKSYCDKILAYLQA